MEQVKAIVEQGYTEIVLTGVHLGAYGADLEPASSLSKIVRTITEVQGLKRVRISSVDPNEIDDELIELVAENPKVCRHLHIPLQSGSDQILEKCAAAIGLQIFATLLMQSGNMYRKSQLLLM